MIGGDIDFSLAALVFTGTMNAILAAAAELAESDLHLALVTIEERGSAEYSGDWRRRRWHDDDDDDDDG